MNCLKIDGVKLKSHIETYHDNHGEYPILVCNEETKEMIKKEKQEFRAFISSETISVPCGEIVQLNSNSKTYWNGARIVVDNELPLGEVRIG